MNLAVCSNNASNWRCVWCTTHVDAHVVTFSYYMFSNHYRCSNVSINVVSGVLVCVGAS